MPLSDRLMRGRRPIPGFMRRRDPSTVTWEKRRQRWRPRSAPTASRGLHANPSGLDSATPEETYSDNGGAKVWGCMQKRGARCVFSEQPSHLPVSPNSRCRNTRRGPFFLFSDLALLSVLLTDTPVSLSSSLCDASRVPAAVKRVDKIFQRRLLAHRLRLHS
jgi:hypothetical protein